MATTLNNRTSKAQSVATILAAKGAILASGFMDEIDNEAAKQGSAMSNIRRFVPARLAPSKRECKARYGFTSYQNAQAR